jgi:hypothetical protein
MPAKTKTRTSSLIRLSWQWSIYQGPKSVGTLVPDGLVHPSPPLPIIPNGVVHLAAEGADGGGQLLVEMTADQNAISPWHLVATQNFDEDSGELVTTIPERVVPHEYAEQPVFIRCRYSASMPQTDPADVARAEAMGWPRPEDPALEPHTVTVTLEYKEQSE